MDDKVYEQVVNVASLPGIVKASYAMPDAHWGYGFPIGGVAAFDPDLGGVISAGGVGFDISCGVRTLHTGLTRADIEPVKERLADALFAADSRGRGQHRRDPPLRLTRWPPCCAVVRGGRSSAAGARRKTWSASRSMAGWLAQTPRRCRSRPSAGSATRWARWGRAITTSRCRRSSRSSTAAARTLSAWSAGAVVISIHCGSRGLGHQIGTEFLKQMALDARSRGLRLAGSRARLRADQFGARTQLSRCDALGHQLRAGQPPDPHAPDAPCFPRHSAAGASRAALRRVAQHLQSGNARGGW